MTKLKSKKMTKSTLAIIIMGIVIVALLAFGGSFAYFTAITNNSKTVNVTTATFALSTNADTAIITLDSPIVVPGQTLVSEAITVSAQVNAKAIIVAKIALTAGEQLTTADLGFGLNETNWELAGQDASGNKYYVYKTTESESTVYYASADVTGLNFTTGAIKLATTVGNNAMGQGISLSIQFGLSQYDYIDAGANLVSPTAADVYTAFQTYGNISGFAVLETPVAP